MEESASKRRRVSPRTTQRTAAASTSASQPPDASSPRRKRPSYASPTKASLSRHNPGILERRSASPTKPASPSKAQSTRSRARRTSDAGSEHNDDELLSAQISDGIAASEAGRGEEPGTDQPGDEPTPTPGSPTRNITRGLAAAPRRSPMKPSPRPLPPPAPDGDDEINPFLGKTIRRSPNTGLPVPLPPEPELPPAVNDPISSTPPRGIHSSPSRWRDRSKPKKSSPLKPKDNRPMGETTGKPKPFAQRLESQTLGEAHSQGPSYHSKTNPERKVPPSNSDRAKRKERDDLLEEIASLKKDLQTVNSENERIRLMQKSGRVLATDSEDALDVVKRHLVANDERPKPIQSKQLLEAALNPMGLLPFAKPAAAVVAADKDEEDHVKIKSHYPVAMKASEELPYLQLFTPFDITSSIAILPPIPSHPLRQRRSIVFRSRDVPGLFTSRIAMIVNAMNLSVLDLSVEALEPAAKPELGPFAERICSGDCNRSIRRNVGVLSWAMGEWYRVAVQRAGFWSQLDREVHSKDGLSDAVNRMRLQGADDDNAQEQPKATCSRRDLMRFMGQQAYEIKVDSESSLRLKWTIGFDWTGEAQSRLGVMVGVPGKWRDADRRGTFGKLPTLFENLVESGQEPAVAVRTIVTLLAGE